MGESNRDVQVDDKNTGPKPGVTTDQWLDATLDQIFLSPRVIDERAYEELSGSLRTLMKDAAGQSRALIQTTGEVKLLGNQLREATQQLQSKVETAVRVIPTLDQRMKQAETLLDLAGKDLSDKVAAMQDAATRVFPIERERIASQLRAEAAVLFEEVMKEQTALLRTFVDAEMRTIEQDVDARLQKFMEPLVRASESLTASVADMERRSLALREQIAQDETRLRSLAAETSQRLERATTQIAGADAIASRVNSCAARAEAAQASIEHTVSEAGVRLGAGISEAERRAGEITRRLETELESVNAALGALHSEVEAARSVRATPAPAVTPFPTVKLPDIETLEKLGAGLRALIQQGDQIGRGLSVLLQRAGK